MEKLDTDESSSKFRIASDLHYKDTLEDGILLFNNVVPAKKEQSAEVLKKLKELEFTEANIYRSFKTSTNIVFNKGNLVYNTKDNKFYRVVDLKTDESYQPLSANLVVKNGDDKLEINDPSDFEHFQDFVNLNILVKSENSDLTCLSVKQKLYEKFEDTLANAFLGEGLMVISFKFFFNGKELDKSMTVAQLDNIINGSYIFATAGLGKPSKFNRFKSVYTSYGWSNSGNYPDGIAFLPQQHIKVCGFSTFAARSKDSYQMKYRVRIDGTDVEEDTIDATGWEDQYYYRHRLKGVYDAPAGSKIEFTCWIADNLASHTYVETYYGEGGYDYEQFENEHMGLFKIESGGDSSNGTSVYSGHFGEIFYYLC